MKRIAVLFSFLAVLQVSHAQAVSYGASVPAGNGSPTTLSIPCSASNASPSTASFWVDTSVTSGNAVWKCILNPTTTQYGWVAPFVSPFQATGTTGVITPPTLVGCTSGTATVTGATTSMAASASPIGSPGTGQINSTAYVSSAGIVTVTLCLPLTLVYTANPVAYKVLVF